MHLPISMWQETLAKLGFKPRKNPKRPSYRRTRRLLLEPLETRQLLTTVTVALGQNATEGSQTGYVTFTRDNTVGSLMVNYSIDVQASTAMYSSDYSQPATMGSVTFSAGSSTVNLSVAPIDDTLVENTESVVFRIQSSSMSSGSYSIGSPSTATCLIYDNGVAPTINVSATQDAAEGGQNGVFTFTRDITTGSLTVYWSLNQTASTAVPGSDFSSPATSGSVTFSSGASSVTLNVVPIDDSLVEGTESVVLRLQSASGSGSSYLLGTASSASVLVTDNDVAATINVAATENAAEPSQSGYFTFIRDVTSGSLTVYYSIDQMASTATTGTDYTGPSTSGSVTFSAGVASVTLNVVPVDDTLVEGTESVVLRLQANSQSSSSYALGESSSASLLVADDDVPATINVAATQNAAEPSESGYFTFTRDITAGSLTVFYSIDQTASTAISGTDYTGPSMSGSVTFAEGASSVTLNVVPVDDTLVETDEAVVLRLQSSSMSGSSYTLGSAASASLLVVDDEPPAVTLLKLLNDTGTSPYDLITTDPTLTGQISSRGNSTDVTVEFDYDGDETVDASMAVEDREFTHTPASLPLGPLTIHARAKRWDAGQSAYVYGDWTSLGFTLADGVNHAPGVTALGLAYGTQDAGGDWSATDPTLVGDVANDGPLAFLKVEFDWTADGEVDGEARTDQAGHFTYKPSGI